ncbi:MAG: tRNA (adenosine(37)-N6)-threonylcarbamoyltransferase complex dimerization subunit type 1 TsaB [Acidobacteriota bacterium]
MKSNPLILSLETATLGGSVFLGQGNDQLAARLGDPTVSHSNSLLSDIAGALEEVGLSLQDVELLACASGPGSFTGLRIGIATLKALAATLGLPCVGVPTLQAVAHAAGPSRATVALLPAGRGELFSQMFSVSDDGQVSQVDAAAHVSPARLMDKYGALENITWAGSGALAQREFLEQQALERGIAFHELAGLTTTSVSGWKVIPEITNLARHVAALAVQLIHSGKVQSPHSLSAIYVRPSDAELKEQCL